MNTHTSSKIKELTDSLSALRKSNPRLFLSLLREIRKVVREINEELRTIKR